MENAEEQVETVEDLRWKRWWDAVEWVKNLDKQEAAEEEQKAAEEEQKAAGEEAAEQAGVDLLDTGQFFWVSLLLRYRLLQATNLRRVSGWVKLQDNSRVVEMSPGGGHDWVLQEFNWAPTIGEFSKQGWSEDDEIVVVTHLECDKTHCRQFVSFCFTLNLTLAAAMSRCSFRSAPETCINGFAPSPGTTTSSRRRIARRRSRSFH